MIKLGNYYALKMFIVEYFCLKKMWMIWSLKGCQTWAVRDQDYPR